jgi:6-phosphogluconolactonase
VNDNSISEFTIGSDGSLAEISGSPIGESFINPSSLLVEPSGKYLYVTNQGSNNVAAYSVGTDGSLTILATPSFTTSAAPSFITTDPSGKFLLIGNQSSPGIQVFRLSLADGTLTSVSTYSVGNTPTSIVVTH